MTNCTQATFDFLPLKRRQIQTEFSGGEVTTDDGVLLLRQVDQYLGLTAAIDAAMELPDWR